MNLKESVRILDKTASAMDCSELIDEGTINEWCNNLRPNQSGAICDYCKFNEAVKVVKKALEMMEKGQ